MARDEAERGLLVSAVEPVAAMRYQTADVPGVAFHDGLAERTGLPDGCADAVVAATAWHWFDAPAAIREVRRWAPLTEASFPNPWPTSALGLEDRLLSSSAITLLPAGEQEQARDELEGVLREHGLAGADEIALPYETTIYWTKPLTSPPGGSARS